MLILVTGGAGSGKSAFAESLLDGWRGEKIYLATMAAGDGESLRRIERHRAMRAGKGFATVERQRDLEMLSLPTGCAVLVEDLPNLWANQFFAPGGEPGREEDVLAGLDTLCSTAARVVVVSGELFSDGTDYAPETVRYLEGLATLHRALAARAAAVYEVVCGIPVTWKGEKA